MKLSEMLAKAKVGLKELFGSDKVDGTDIIIDHPCRTAVEQRDCIELKNCGKETWVRAGSNCHNNGVCGTCIGEPKVVS
jgi:hypothetical protein